MMVGHRILIITDMWLNVLQLVLGCPVCGSEKEIEKNSLKVTKMKIRKEKKTKKLKTVHLGKKN